MSLQSHLGRVRGLGSAKDGTHHWWWQRLTAIALVPLSIWFVCGLLDVLDSSYSEATAWVAKPHVTVLLLVFVAALFYHMKLGMQVVIEDYLHVEWMKISALIALKFACALGAIAAIVAILKISL
ncbi:MAG: succinate dehydrogenase, hydrophobic membrane anchor protein [Pseudomonadota bacterium]